MSTSLSINLKRANKVYHEGDVVAGVVVVESSSDVRHEGLTLVAEGAVSLTLSGKGVGLFDAFSNTMKPVPPPLPLLSACVPLCAAGRLPAGVTHIPFEVPLAARSLLETYHGVFVSVMYSLKCTMRRPFLNKPLYAGCQFFVQHRRQEPPPLKPVRCEITPASVRASGGTGPGTGIGSGTATGTGTDTGTGTGAGRSGMPQFQIYAEIDSTVCSLDKPLTGKIRVDECSVPIKSIELQLVRVETCASAEGHCRDATEIQNIQVGEGDVVRGRDLPLYMVLPRLFTCPTTTALNFKIEFELNIAVIFEDDYLVTENFPILLVRSR